MSVPVVLRAKASHKATVIFLHGLGDTGHGWAAALNSIKTDHVKIVCPNAPSIPVTLNQGFVMPAWYDIKNLDANSKDREDLEGMKKSVKVLEALIGMETKELGGHTDKIVIGGFSQGGAVALSALLRAQKPFGGCMALSTYLTDEIAAENKDVKEIETPVLHCHGESDEMIPFERGLKTSHRLSKLVKDYKFHTFPDMGHECTEDELEVMKQFLHEKLLSK